MSDALVRALQRILPVAQRDWWTATAVACELRAGASDAEVWRTVEQAALRWGVAASQRQARALREAQWPDAPEQTRVTQRVQTFLEEHAQWQAAVDARAAKARARWRAWEEQQAQRAADAADAARVREQADATARTHAAQAQRAAEDAAEAFAAKVREGLRVARYESCVFACEPVVAPQLNAWEMGAADDYRITIDDDDAFYIEQAGWALIGATRTRPFSGQPGGRARTIRPSHRARAA